MLELRSGTCAGLDASSVRSSSWSLLGSPGLALGSSRWGLLRLESSPGLARGCSECLTALGKLLVPILGTSTPVQRPWCGDTGGTRLWLGCRSVPLFRVLTRSPNPSAPSALLLWELNSSLMAIFHASVAPGGLAAVENWCYLFVLEKLPFLTCGGSRARCSCTEQLFPPSGLESVLRREGASSQLLGGGQTGVNGFVVLSQPIPREPQVIRPPSVLWPGPCPLRHHRFGLLADAPAGH